MSIFLCYGVGEFEHMRKRVVGLLVFISFILFSLPLSARAEQPKLNDTIRVTFTGEQEEIFYVTLLSELRAYGGTYAWDGKEQHAKYHEGDAEYDIWKAFVSYEDPDGYFFFQKFKECSDTKLFEERYLRPTFKILVYYPNSNSFFCSDVLDRYDEMSEFSIDLTSGIVSRGESEEEKNIRRLTMVKNVQKAGKAIAGVMILVGAAWNWFKKKKQRPRPDQEKLIKLNKTPDMPLMLGYKTGWIAIKADSSEEVIKKLGMKILNVANWKTGLANRTGQQYFVTPVMDNYVFISDVLELLTEDLNKLDEIATEFEEVLFFGTHRIVELCLWGKYVKGIRIRRYYYLGESGEVISEGNLTVEEVQLGGISFPTSEKLDSESEELIIPNEDTVIAISKAWGADPFFETHRAEKSTGYLVEWMV